MIATRDGVRDIHGKNGGRNRITVASSDESADEQDAPDLLAMSLEELAVYIDGCLASSHAAEQRSLLQAHKSAVALYWAGAALFEARSKCNKEGRGKWKDFKEEHGFKHSTANDAIRLFEESKTPHALAGMGITEAKNKFIYPPKAEQRQQTKVTRPAPTSPQVTPTGRAPSQDQRSDSLGRRKRLTTDTSPEGDQEDHFTPVDPADSIAEELEDIAQRLSEIGQDDLGKVDLSKQVPARLRIAVQAVARSLANVHRRISREEPTA